ncbi:MAG: nucleotide exchange factor GrpE [Alphaproteobacteria bacterium]|nr:nucleotide exchange factor GrpE [Alphaproteobacteria bacterium]MBR6327252.1 nucleotide exchange factor GrpE [Alphaproteobacteria bacterium]
MTKHHHDKQHHEFDQESGKSETLENEVESAEEDALQDLAQENQKLKDELLRALADSENIKKRCAAEIEKNSKYAISSFAKDLLGVADNLDRALQATQTEDNTSCQALLEGVKLTQKELSHVFEKFGITKMECIGQPFDPNFHQVIQQVSDPSHPAGTIITELQTGYMINGRILREAMVVVATE